MSVDQEEYYIPSVDLLTAQVRKDAVFTLVYTWASTQLNIDCFCD